MRSSGLMPPLSAGPSAEGAITCRPGAWTLMHALDPFMLNGGSSRLMAAHENRRCKGTSAVDMSMPGKCCWPGDAGRMDRILGNSHREAKQGAQMPVPVRAFPPKVDSVITMRCIAQAETLLPAQHEWSTCSGLHLCLQWLAHHQLASIVGIKSNF